MAKSHLGFIRAGLGLLACAGLAALASSGRRPSSPAGLMSMSIPDAASESLQDVYAAALREAREDNGIESLGFQLARGASARRQQPALLPDVRRQQQARRQATSQQLSRQHRCERACGSWFECDCGEQEADRPWQQPRLSAEQQDALPTYPFFPAPLAGAWRVASRD